MESRVIQLTQAALDYGNLNIRTCGKGFFPPDAFGGSSRTSGLGVPITLHVEGLPNPIETDIPKDKKTGNPRWIFRKRKWVKDFVLHYKLRQDNTLTIERLDERNYKISPNNNLNQLIHKEHSNKQNKTSTESSSPVKTQRKLLNIGYERTCNCLKNHINCLSAKEWLKCQLGVWQFTYEGRDIRDKKLHPATFPISLARKVIDLFTHKGELVLDPFVGSGTTLIAAQDGNRNAVGFDLQKQYIRLTENRLTENSQLFGDSKQIAVCDDAQNIHNYLKPDTISLIFTSPPYANLLNRRRKNKSRRNRKNEQLGKVEQYSQNPRDLGTMDLSKYTKEMGDIFEKLLPLLRPKSHCVINVPDMWWENRRITIHVSLVEELRRRGYELRNVIIWDRTNIVNQIGIFGWPSNYITMGVTFEYLLDFWRPTVPKVTKEIPIKEK
jgi:DNA modification methylase